jgi:hypothetical protein
MATKQNETATQEERLVAILTHMQCLHTKFYTLMSGHEDWLVVLQCMQDHGFFKSNPSRPPFAAFEQWLRDHNVPQRLAHCSVRNLTYVNKKIRGARYPWTDVAWEPGVLKRWRVTYDTLAKMLKELKDTSHVPEQAFKTGQMS